MGMMSPVAWFGIEWSCLRSIIVLISGSAGADVDIASYPWSLACLMLPLGLAWFETEIVLTVVLCVVAYVCFLHFHLELESP